MEIVMDALLFHQTIEIIVEAIKEAGYDPYEQLVGYLLTGQDYYITRTSNARGLIGTLDQNRLKQYVNDLKKDPRTYTLSEVEEELNKEWSRRAENGERTHI